MLLGVLLVYGCGVTESGGGGNNTTPGGGGGITLTGSFSGGSHASLFDKVLNWLSSPAEALVTGDIKYVLVVGPSNFNSCPVPTAVDANGNFSLSGIPSNQPCGIVFLGASHDFKGYYLLPNGMSSLPLNAATGGTLSLGTLNSSGLIVTSNITFSTMFNLNAEQEDMLKGLEGSFSSSIKNPDKNNNGIVDCYENKYWGMNILYWIGRAGENGLWYGNSITFTSSNATTYAPGAGLTYPVTLTGHKLIFIARDPGVSSITTVNYDRPAPGVDITSGQDTNTITGGKIFFSAFTTGSVDVVPDAGTYTISYVGGAATSVTFNLPSQANADENLVVIRPTVHLNNSSDKFVQSISVEFKNGKDGNTIDPAPIFESYSIQLTGTGNVVQSPTPTQWQRLYNADNLPNTTTSHTLSLSGLRWVNVSNITMAYNDVYQNHYVISFDNPEFVGF